MTTLIAKNAGFLTTLLKPSSVWTLLIKWNGLAKQRAALRTMDDQQLLDLGLTRAQAEAEANRSVWDAPANWSR